MYTSRKVVIEWPSRRLMKIMEKYKIHVFLVLVSLLSWDVSRGAAKKLMITEEDISLSRMLRTHNDEVSKQNFGGNICGSSCFRSCNKTSGNSTQWVECANDWMNHHCRLLGFFPNRKKRAIERCVDDLQATCKGHLCGDGSCAANGQCCLNERPCGDGKCVVPGTCCASETQCSDGTCIGIGDNVTCSQINTTMSFISFMSDVSDASVAFTTIDPQLVNDMVDILRSKMDDKGKGRITAEGLINFFFPNPNATFTYYGSEANNMNASKGNSRELAMYKPHERFMGIDSDYALEVYKSRELFLDDSPCTKKFVIFMVQTTMWVISAITLFPFSVNSANAFVKALFAKSEDAGKLISDLAKAARIAWDEGNKVECAQYSISFLANLAKTFGMQVFWNALTTSATTEEISYMSMGFVLSLVAVFFSEGLTLSTQIGMALVNLFPVIEAGASFYDTCFPDDTCVITDCDDSNSCTVDVGYCDNGSWICDNFERSCFPGFGCNPQIGSCEPINELIPCIAVIDEDSSFGNPDQATLWAEFRSEYPSRPFCLIGIEPTGLAVPQNFLDDGFAGYISNVARDYGDSSLASSWMELCGWFRCIQLIKCRYSWLVC